MSRRWTRRSFLGAASSAAGATLALPSILQGSPLSTLHIAGVGVGGKGAGDIASTSKGQRVVAICDVDARTLGKAGKRYPKAKRYADWRRLLEQPGIDAVTVSTPDHMHAPIAVSAMELGKHVYVQKPMAHTVFEARAMRKLAAEKKVVTQMGNQGHSGTGYRTLVRLLRSGVVGRIREAHAWSNRPGWPQGIQRPKRSAMVPDWLSWNEWLGVAPLRPYVAEVTSKRKDKKGRPRRRAPYHPFCWRGWIDFGVGALGDMGCHILDPVVWGLELGAPRWVWSDGPAPNGETWPEWETIHWEFEPTEWTAGDTVVVTWYDGGKKPRRELADLEDGEKLPSNGSLYIGEKGQILCRHGGEPVLLPAKDFAESTVEKVPGDDHYQQWTKACLGEGTTTSHFDYAGPLTETVLLGTIAVQYPGDKLGWNSDALRIENHDGANHFVTKPYREGWAPARLAGSAAAETDEG